MIINKIRFIAALCFFMTVSGQFTVSGQTASQPETLPDIEIKMHNNEIVKLTALKGKVVLLDFWFRSCLPCLQSVPYLIELQEEFKGDLVIIGINDSDDSEGITDYFNYKKVNYLSTYKTDNRLSKLFNVTMCPTTILYDKDGNLIKASSGFSKSEMRSLRRAIKKVLQ